MKRISTLILVLALPLTLSACGGDDDPAGPDVDADDGTFALEMSGDVEQSLEGVAYFGAGTDPETGESGWILWLSTSEDESTGQTLYFVRNGDRPGTGTYTLSDPDALEGNDTAIGAVFLGTTGTNSTTMLVSTGGSLVVTESSDGDMEGSFTVQAQGTSFVGGQPAEANVTITGEFDAESGETFHPGF